MDSTLLIILLPALAAGILVLSTHVLLGRQVLKRGIIFIDLAIAQVAALGAILAKTVHEFEHLPYANLLLPLIFALLGAVIIAWLAKRFADELEAMIGCLYVMAAVLAILLLTNNPHGAELLKQLMDGQILWVDWPQLLLPSFVYAAILLLLWLKPQLLTGSSFYLLFAVVITLSVELVGVYLVFSSLILPALAVNKLNSRHALWVAYGVGIVGYLTGLLLSAQWDLPSGATIVMSLMVLGMLIRLFRRRGAR
ncbi:metal ABC transporter permease [Parashewanella curva]|uniref:Metal ABC transporter permease n=1 Tax=Parashewanella curva TaxID=2338552 RepID=A0A3L8PZX6_9GAMM|nr:metal ABC transporter permease [Parashewanella curva]RLV60934.1 metal ABC transporter permease [Parashewanella curva]